MNSKPLSELLEEAFVRCRDMDASLAERLQAFAEAVQIVRAGVSKLGRRSGGEAQGA